MNNKSSIAKRKQRSIQFKSIVLFLIICFICFSCRNLRNAQFNVETFSNPLFFYSLNKPVTILIAGTDQVYERDKYGNAVKSRTLSFTGRTDTIIVAKFDPVLKRISALNIPRDTRIYLNGKRAEKINAINAINAIGGSELLKEILGNLLDIEIDHFVIINTKGVEQIIDAMGGIEINIQRRMHYRDRTDGLIIDFEPGKRLLNGKEAVEFLRFRHDVLGDIGRIQRQQLFFRSVKDKLSSTMMISRIPKFVETSMKAIKTDMTVNEIIKLANFAKSVSSTAQIFATLPGDFSMPIEQIEFVEVIPEQNTAEKDSANTQTEDETKEEGNNNVNKSVKILKRIVRREPYISYWIPNEKAIIELVDRLFGSDPELTEEYATKKNETPEVTTIALEIANYKDANYKNIVSFLTNELHSKGYRIVDISSDLYDKKGEAVIYTQKADIKRAEILRKDLGLSSSIKILGASVGSPLADITIVLGADMIKEFQVRIK